MSDAKSNSFKILPHISQRPLDSSRQDIQPGKGVVSGQLGLPEKSQRRRRNSVQWAGFSRLSKQSQEDKRGGSLRGCPNAFSFSKVDQTERDER